MRTEFPVGKEKSALHIEFTRLGSGRVQIQYIAQDGRVDVKIMRDAEAKKGDDETQDIQRKSSLPDQII